jgi:cytochrome oxidase Cu insertion factor (SCO1/SenC/PrrC family)
MFCPYPSSFDARASGACVSTKVSPTTSAPAIRCVLRAAGQRPERSERKADRRFVLARSWRARTRAGLAITACLAWLASTSRAAEPFRSSGHDYEPPVPGTYTLPIVKPAADGAVFDSAGRSLRLRELTRGRVTVLSFIYTRCTADKACPLATGVLNQLHRLSQEDRSLAENLRLVSMSFDPENDTPKRMAAYAAWAGGRKTSAEWYFITTRSQSELRPILDAYGQAVDKKQNPADPTGPLNHTLRVFLIDRDGHIRNIYSSGTLDPRLVLADVKTLMGARPEAQRVVRSENALLEHTHVR